MSKIVIIANPDKPEAVRFAEEVNTHLQARGDATRLSIDLDDDFSNLHADIAVVFGGDGTVLGVIQRFSGNVPPILAFNLGRLGYLAGNPPHDMMARIDDAIAGKLSESSRMMLQVEVKFTNGQAWNCLGLNEIVLAPVRPGRMVPLEVQVDGEDVMYTRGDGIIVATPTGSTAYALSAGGPVASPELDAMIITPICPHQLANRPLVLGPEEKVVLRHFGVHEVELTVDGSRRIAVESDATVRIGKSTERVRLLTPLQERFQILREKLGWGWGADTKFSETASYL